MMIVAMRGGVGWKSERRGVMIVMFISSWLVRGASSSSSSRTTRQTDLGRDNVKTMGRGVRNDG
jgi:hypothetical protein